VDWWVARQMHRQPTPARRKAWLWLSIAVNLGFLGFFKYGKFLVENWQMLMSLVGVHYVPPTWDVLLPVGISFYTFHSMSYTLDVYWRRVEPIPRLFDYALFVAFFTQLVAGPILRKSDLVPQFAKPRTATVDQFCWGVALMTLGLFEKVVLADGALAPAVDAVYGNGDPVGGLDAWIGTFGFSGQVFCDFAGYSTVAVGAAMCLGFSIPSNFRCPYGSLSISEFWRRWHLSLSSWLRDYLYFPLGGSKKGEARTCLNLFVTMLVCGLWHGANWTYVIWGGLHGIFLGVERGIRRVTQGWRIPTGLAFKLALLVLTFTVVATTRVFFRSKTLAGSVSMLASLAGMHHQADAILPTVQILETLACVVGILAAHWYMRDRELEAVVARAPHGVLAGAWAAMAFSIIITQGDGDAFIYFQF
jgi:alginate O-acetyltransferase complex protein AlgI